MMNKIDEKFNGKFHVKKEPPDLIITLTPLRHHTAKGF